MLPLRLESPLDNLSEGLLCHEIGCLAWSARARSDFGHGIAGRKYRSDTTVALGASVSASKSKRGMVMAASTLIVVVGGEVTRIIRTFIPSTDHQ